MVALKMNVARSIFLVTINYRPLFLIFDLNYPPDIHILDFTLKLSFRLDKSSYAFFLCKLADEGQEIIHGCVLCLEVNNKS